MTAFADISVALPMGAFLVFEASHIQTVQLTGFWR